VSADGRNPSCAVIFDVDGTLVDTNYLHTVAWARGIREMGETVSMSAIHRLIGMGSDHLVEELLGRESQEASDGHSRHFDELKAEIVAFPAAVDLLEEVHRRGAMVLLASSASDDDMKAMMDALQPPEDAIDHMTKKDDVDQSKPSPDVFQVALDATGMDAEKVLVVGDTVWDVEAAGRANLRFVGVTTGGISRQELERAGAVAVYEDVADLLRNLDDSPLGELIGREERAEA
jgi:HAD superfamily hydrolase (TIGR01549 family)